MTIASEITNYANGLSDAYNAVNDMQGVIPQDKNMNNLDTAIRTIPQSQGSTYTAGNGINIDANNEISIDTTVVAEVSDLPTDFTGATSSTAGTNGLVPAPSAGDEDKVLKGDGTWGEATSLTNFYLANPLKTYTSGDTLSLYTDASLTTAITQQDFANAVEQGGVRLINSDSTRHWLNIYELSFVEDDGSHSITNPDSREYEFLDLSDGFSYHSITSDGPVASTNFTYNVMTEPQYLTAGSNITISQNVISATDTTYSDFTGASSSAAGTNGLVPAPAAGDEGKALHGDGTWKDTTAKLVEMSYGESNAWAKFIAAYNAGSIVYCRASSNANPGTGSQTRKAFMAYVNNAASPTSVEFQYVRSVSSKSSSQPVDQIFVYTLTNASGGTWSVATRDMAPKLAAGTNTSVSYSSGTYTVSATDTTYSTGNATTAGITKLYTATGQNIDGGVTQKLFTDTVGDVETILQTLISGNGAA